MNYYTICIIRKVV